MKWFKHISESGDDPDIGAIMDKFGNQGYYLFFRIIEIMAKEFDINNPGRNSFNFHWFLERFRRGIGKKSLLNFLAYTTKLGRIKSRLNHDTIHLNCPKLKELADEYTEKMLKKIGTKSRQESGQNPAHRLRRKNKSKNIKEYSDDLILLTDLLIKKIKENDPKAKVPEVETEQFFKWVDNIRLCIDRDKRTVEEINQAIQFSQNSDFWKGNILSTAKLRRQMPTLLLQSKRDGYKVSQVGKSSYVPSKEVTKRQDAINAYRAELMKKYKPKMDKAKKDKDLDAIQAIENTINTEVAQKSQEL